MLRTEKEKEIGVRENFFLYVGLSRGKDQKLKKRADIIKKINFTLTQNVESVRFSISLITLNGQTTNFDERPDNHWYSKVLNKRLYK